MDFREKGVFLCLAAFLLLAFPNSVFAESDGEKNCAVYFTKIGCPVCSKTDPEALGSWPEKYKNLVIIEYVFESWSSENAELLWEYATSFGFSSSVPTIVFEKEHAQGLPPLADIEAKIPSVGKKCRFLDEPKSFEETDLGDLPAEPKVWANGRVLIRLGKGNVESDFLKEVLFTQNLSETLWESDYRIAEIEASPEAISYGQIDFKKAFRIGDSWVLKCNEEIAPNPAATPTPTATPVPAATSNPGSGNGNSGGSEGNGFYSVVLVSVIGVAALVLLLFAFIAFRIKAGGVKK